MKIYKKLVRDKIPLIIRNSGREAVVKILKESSYKKALDRKLKEELKEYEKSKEPEELADMEEVIRSILVSKKISRQKFEKIITEKRKEKGGFSKRIELISVK